MYKMSSEELRNIRVNTMRYELEPTFVLVPPTNTKPGFVGNVWNTIKTSEAYESLGMRYVVDKMFALIFEIHEDPTPFDYILYLILLLMCMKFIISSIHTIFFVKPKPVKKICKNVKSSNNALHTILRTFWDLKKIKLKELITKLELKNFNKKRSRTCGLNSNMGNKSKDAAVVTSPIKTSKPEIYYSHEGDFPIVKDCSPKNNGDPSEIPRLVVSEKLPIKHPRNQKYKPFLPLPTINEVPDVVKKTGATQEKRSSVSNVKPYFTRDFNSTNLADIRRTHSVPNTPRRKEWNKPVIEPSKDYKTKKEKLEQNNSLTNNVKPAKHNGIFPERKKVLEKVKPTKSIEQTKNDGSAGRSSPRSKTKFTNNSVNSTQASRDVRTNSGFFNKSKSRPRL